MSFIGDRFAARCRGLAQLFRMPAARLRSGLLSPAFLFFSVGLDSPVVGNARGDRDQNEAEKACREVHIVNQERKFQPKAGERLVLSHMRRF